MQKYLKALFATGAAVCTAAATAYVQGNGHIGWAAGLTLASGALASLAVVWGVPNKS